MVYIIALYVLRMLAWLHRQPEEVQEIIDREYHSLSREMWWLTHPIGRHSDIPECILAKRYCELRWHVDKIGTDENFISVWLQPLETQESPWLILISWDDPQSHIWSKLRADDEITLVPAGSETGIVDCCIKFSVVKIKAVYQLQEIEEGEDENGQEG